MVSRSSKRVRTNETLICNRPANVPQRHANQATHARYAAHARTFFRSDFVSIENKGSEVQLPKLKVASSSLVARSSLLGNSFGSIFKQGSQAGLGLRLVRFYETLAVDFTSRKTQCGNPSRSRSDA